MSFSLESFVGSACPLIISIVLIRLGRERGGGLTVVSFSVSSPNPVRDEVTG